MCCGMVCVHCSRYERCDEYIQDLEDGRLATQPGCTEEESLEVLA